MSLEREPDWMFAAMLPRFDFCFPIGLSYFSRTYALLGKPQGLPGVLTPGVKEKVRKSCFRHCACPPLEGAAAKSPPQRDPDRGGDNLVNL